MSHLSSSSHKLKLYNYTRENHTSKVHLDLQSLPENRVKLSGIDKSSAFHVSWARSRVGMTFGSMTVNDNVTCSHAPVTLGSAQPGQWSIRDTGGFFGPLTPPPFPPIPTPSQCLDQPPACSHMAPHSVKQQCGKPLSFSNIVHSVELHR